MNVTLTSRLQTKMFSNKRKIYLVAGMNTYLLACELVEKRKLSRKVLFQLGRCRISTCTSQVSDVRWSTICQGYSLISNYAFMIFTQVQIQSLNWSRETTYHTGQERNKCLTNSWLPVMFLQSLLLRFCCPFLLEQKKIKFFFSKFREALIKHFVKSKLREYLCEFLTSEV